MVSEKYISIQEAKYLLAKHVPTVMGALMLERFELHPQSLFGMAELVISYYSTLTHKLYGFSQPVEYELIKNRPDMVRHYLDCVFRHILRDVYEEEMKDQEDILLERVKGEMAMEMERRQNVK
jgi:hypothetical protein